MEQSMIKVIVLSLLVSGVMSALLIPIGVPTKSQSRELISIDAPVEDAEMSRMQLSAPEAPELVHPNYAPPSEDVVQTYSI